MTFRKFALAFTVAALFNYFEKQTLVICIINGLYLIYLLLVRPYKQKRYLIAYLVSELSINISFILIPLY